MGVLQKTDILGVGITKESKEKILEQVFAALSSPKTKLQKILIFTPNPEQISAAARDSSLKNILNEASISLPDGVGVVWAARLLGKPIYARITGIDFMEILCEKFSKEPVITGFLGGQEGVAEAAAECLRKKWPKLRVGYASDVYNKQKMIHSDIDILFVALGFPKQEKWIVEHKDEIPATVIMSVGGAFDFISGKVPRAPKHLRSLGFEWLFRLAIQPWRFFRQLQILHFGGLIFLEALANRFKTKNSIR
jgi:N-acetylglucosaminyldiphosphoundecaprenol N-acetyl-beta-D-mannosaminyltransferase